LGGSSTFVEKVKVLILFEKMHFGCQDILSVFSPENTGLTSHRWTEEGNLIHLANHL